MSLRDALYSQIQQIIPEFQSLQEHEKLRILLGEGPASISLSSPSVNVSYSGTVFSHCCTLDSYSLQKEVSQMKPVTSLLDPIPTSLFQSCFASLCPVVLSIINDSLCTGVVPPSFQIAAVTPVPKKTNIDYENLSNFRPISNLPFLVKILERVVASQLISHLTENNLFEPLQSGFLTVLKQHWSRSLMIC